MARILLLDDSVTIHKVVRLTLSSSPELELKVGKSPAEGSELLSSFRPDVVIAYIRFSGDANPSYFLQVKEKCSAILLLTESNENLEAFVAAGFGHFLKKPFHSDELRQLVKSLIPVQKPILNTEQDFELDLDLNNFSEEEATLAVRVPSANAYNQSHSSFHLPPPPPLPPLPLSASSAETPSLPPFPTLQESFETESPRKISSQTPTVETDFLSEVPQITMDVDSLEKFYRATLSQQEKLVVEPDLPVIQEIEIDSSFALEPLNLENVVLHSSVGKKVDAEFIPPPRAHPDPYPTPEALRREIALAVDEAFLKALDSTLLDKIFQKIQAQWPQLMIEFKNTALEQILNDIRPEFKIHVEEWISRESVHLVKEVVREEIRRVLQE